MNHYRNILLDYEARYKSFPLAKVLEEKNKEVADLESQVMESESNIQQLKSKIHQFEGKNTHKNPHAFPLLFFFLQLDHEVSTRSCNSVSFGCLLFSVTYVIPSSVSSICVVLDLQS